MTSQNRYLIDFDSTFTQVEALDELAKISLKNHPDKASIFQRIRELTNAAMEGRLSFRESLSERIQLLNANRDHLDRLIKVLRSKISVSFSRNKTFFKKHSDQVFIISGGFKEFIIPVTTPYHIKAQHVFANTFLVDESGRITGYDDGNPLSEEGGKVKLLKSLGWEGEIYMIGDGYSDYQLKESGLVKQFFAFTENIERAAVTRHADRIIPSFDEFLYTNKLPMAISYPKNRIKVLLTGVIPEETFRILKKEGYELQQKEVISGEDMREAGILVIGAGAKLPKELLNLADRLKVIAFFGNSRPALDLTACTLKGVVVFDDPKNNPRNKEFLAKRIIEFINKGGTHTSINFPNIHSQTLEKAHRLIHIHRNVPGIMAEINGILASYNINILGQFLKTNEHIGYVITDVNMEYDQAVLNKLKEINHTIKFRILY